MVTQFRMTLIPERDCEPRPGWGYYLYSALLAQAPTTFGTVAHQEGTTPVSQFLTCQAQRMMWTVNLLGKNCEQLLTEILDKLEYVEITKDQVKLQVAAREKCSITNIEEILRLSAGHNGVHKLHFETATAFKSQGQYVNLPTIRLIIQSIFQKWNGCITESPLEDVNGQRVEALAAGLRCRDFQLQDRMYPLKGQRIRGFVGDMVLENHLTGSDRQLADALLLFSGYSGVGIKTALGMGGVVTKSVL